MKAKLAAPFGVVAAAALLGAGLTGCSTSVKTEVSKTSSVTADALQKDLTDKITNAGLSAKVNCKDDLVAEVGKTARCDVSFNDTNSVEAVLTVTKVDGGSIDYDMNPAMTKEQVEKAVAALAAAPKATCDSGLDGRLGETTKCDIDIDGKPSKRVVEVTQVDPAKLGIELSVFMILPKEKVSEVLLQKLNADGTPAETVECVEDASSKAGSAVECVAVTGNDRQGYDVTVTDVLDPDNFDVDYKAKP